MAKEALLFWDSVYSALDVMTRGETLLVILGYMLIMLIPIILIFLILRKKHALSTHNFRVLFLPAIEAVAAAMAVLTLFPVILGLGNDAVWNFPFRIMKLSPGSFLGLLGTLIVLAYIIDIIPGFRKLQSFKTLLLGAVSLIFVQFFLNFINPIVEIDLLDLIPGFWFVCGVVLISAALSKLGHFVFVSFAKVLGKKFDLKEEVAELLILPVIATMGLLPVFIYGAWLS